jgi:hypothetical protein
MTERRAMDEKQELEALRIYAHEATKVLTGLAGGGSELFAGQIGNMFKADLHFCKMRISDRRERLHGQLVAEVKKSTALREEIKELCAPRPAEVDHA